MANISQGGWPDVRSGYRRLEEEDSSHDEYDDDPSTPRNEEAEGGLKQLMDGKPNEEIWPVNGEHAFDQSSENLHLSFREMGLN